MVCGFQVSVAVIKWVWRKIWCYSDFKDAITPFEHYLDQSARHCIERSLAALHQYVSFLLPGLNRHCPVVLQQLSYRKIGHQAARSERPGRALRAQQDPVSKRPEAECADAYTVADAVGESLTSHIAVLNGGE